MFKPSSLLGQLPAPSASEIYTWLVCVVCVAAIYYLIIRIVKEHRRTPSVDDEFDKKADIKMVEKLEGKMEQLKSNVEEQYEKLSQELNLIDTRMRDGFADVERTRRQSIGNLHEQLKGAEIKLSAVGSDTRNTQHKVDQLDVKIDHMPERIIALLNKDRSK